MLLHLPGILSAGQLAECRELLSQAEWVDGRTTAGHRFARVKHNRQLPERHPVARQLGDLILGTLERSPLFMSAALPKKIVPPLFNRYEGGETYGDHVDGAIFPIAGTPHRVRTDLAATLFLTPVADYDGGELVIDDIYGAHRVKLPAGSMILYPGSSLHRVEPVTRGTRLAAFFWIESMVRGVEQRRLLFDLDSAIRELTAVARDHPAIDRLINVYHNLLRGWADT
jgi:PKHD-type hydroxylase